MATDMVQKTIYITDKMLEDIEGFKEKLGLPQTEIIRVALALGLKELEGKEGREEAEREEREAREKEYDRFCEALDKRLDEELKVSYSAFAVSSYFLPKILERIIEEKGYELLINGFKDLNSVDFAEIFLHIGAGMAGANGILSEGLIDAIDWGWDISTQNTSSKKWKKDMHNATANVIVARDGKGFPTKGAPKPRIARDDSSRSSG